MLKYNDRNYSFEISEGKLSSIQLYGHAGFQSEAPSGLPDVGPLREALRSRSAKEALGFIAGDLEIYHGGQVSFFRRAAASEVADSTSKIHDVLFGERSVRAAFAHEPEPDVQLRVREQGPAGPVYKFKADSPVKELALRWEYGAWRIWEIRLR